MAQNTEYNDPVMKMYEALAIVEEKNQEIQRLQKENEELRRNQQGSSHSAASPETLNAVCHRARK